MAEGESKDPKELRELYKIYRDYIQHEDSNTNFRLTWFMAAQIFLFSAYGYYFVERIKPRLGDLQAIDIWTVPKLLKGPSLSLNLDVAFVMVLVYVGFVSAWISYRSVRIANRSINALRSKWEEDVLGQKGAKHKTLPGLTYGGSKRPRWFVGYLPNFLPRAALLFWAIIFVAHAGFIR